MEHRTTESDTDMSENEKEKSVPMSSSCHIQIKQTATETVEAESSNMVISYFGRKRNQVWRQQQLCFQNMQINITIQNLKHLHDTSKL